MNCTILIYWCRIIAVIRCLRELHYQLKKKKIKTTYMKIHALTLRRSKVLMFLRNRRRPKAHIIACKAATIKTVASTSWLTIILQYQSINVSSQNHFLYPALISTASKRFRNQVLVLETLSSRILPHPDT